MTEVKDLALLNAISLTIKDLRKEQKKTQADVSYDTGIHIGRIETGTDNMSVSTISALCKYFKISLPNFYTRVEKYYTLNL